MKKIFSIILTFSFVFMPNVNFCMASKSVLATRVQKSEINQRTIKDERPKKVSTATNKKMSALKIGEIMAQLSMSAIFGVSTSLMELSIESLYKKIGKFVNKFAELKNKNKKYESILKVQKDIKDKKKEKLTLIKQNFNKANDLLNFPKALKSINIDLQKSIKKRSDIYIASTGREAKLTGCVLFFRLLLRFFR